MKKHIVIVVFGFLLIKLLNSCTRIFPCKTVAYTYMRTDSAIELSGLPYDKIKIELSEFSQNIMNMMSVNRNISKFDDVGILQVVEVSGISVTINNQKIKFDDKYVDFDDEYMYRYDSVHSYRFSWGDRSYRYRSIKVYRLIKGTTRIPYDAAQVDPIQVDIDITKFNKSKNKFKNRILNNFLRINFYRYMDHLYDECSNILGSTFFYRLKVDTDGLEANKNLFDKKIQFTPEDSETFIRIDIANKKIDIRHFFLCIPFCEN